MSEPTKLWLWKNFVDGRPEYWAFDNPYPCEEGGGDPLTLGEPCGYALVKESTQGRFDVTEAEVIDAIKASQLIAQHGADAEAVSSELPMGKRTVSDAESYSVPEEVASREAPEAFTATSAEFSPAFVAPPSQTPRTDAAWAAQKVTPVGVDCSEALSVSRQLERELAEANERGENLHAKYRETEAELQNLQEGRGRLDVIEKFDLKKF